MLPVPLKDGWAVGDDEEIQHYCSTERVVVDSDDQSIVRGSVGGNGLW